MKTENDSVLYFAFALILTLHYRAPNQSFFELQFVDPIPTNPYPLDPSFP